MKIILKFLLFGIFMVGCTSSPVIINYSPSILLERAGVVNVGHFKYKQFEDGLVKSNEIKKSTVGDLIIDKNLTDLIESALKLEFKFTGIMLSRDTKNELTGVIERVLFDDLGFDLDTEIIIKYKLSNINGVCFQESLASRKKSPKFSNPFGQLSENIKSNIAMLLENEKFIRCIR